MPAVSSYVQPVAEAIAGQLQTVSPDLKVYVWSPQDLDSVPAAVILPPTLRRVEPDESDLVPLGFVGLVLEYPVVLFFDVSTPEYSQTEAVAYMEQAVLAVDKTGLLTVNGVIDSKMVVSDFRADLETVNARRLLAYECEAHVLMAVPNP